jgi:uncharacterized FlaG/YvyC family protein
MGSGLSLTNEQVVNIIKRDLKEAFKENEIKKDLNRYTADGIEIFQDFSEEAKLRKTIKEIDEFVEKLDKLNNYYYDKGYSKNNKK